MPNGRVILDARGRCFRVESRDEWYARQQVRFGSEGNITDGYYLPYTRAQYHALKDGVAVAANLRANSFRFDLVFGHDEVSPGRKQGPGGAVAHEGRLMTMAAFRQEI